MTGTPETLEERLRAYRPYRFGKGEWFGPKVCTEAADEIASLRARVEVLETALVSEREDNLWHAYHSGHVRDGEWDHMCMSDGESLAHECGFNVKDRRIADADIRAAIPQAARQALKDTPVE